MLLIFGLFLTVVIFVKRAFSHSKTMVKIEPLELNVLELPSQTQTINDRESPTQILEKIVETFLEPPIISSNDDNSDINENDEVIQLIFCLV